MKDREKEILIHTFDLVFKSAILALLAAGSALMVRLKEAQ
jgi:hypothetical protein